MMRLMTIFLTSVILPWTSGALAAELIVNAPVIASEPIEEVSERHHCRAEMPSSDDLIALLQWNLCLPPYRDVATERAIRGYRVTYRWDGRVFKRLMHEPPGDTIPIQVRLN